MKTKKIVLATLFILVSLFTISIQKTDARGLIVWGTADKMKKLADLPDSANYQLEDGKYFDPGIKYTVFHIFWIPIWTTKNAVACGYIDKDNYVEFSDADTKTVCEENKIDITGKVKVPFWDRFGGKSILGLLLIIAFFGYFSKK